MPTRSPPSPSSSPARSLAGWKRTGRWTRPGPSFGAWLIPLLLTACAAGPSPGKAYPVCAGMDERTVVPMPTEPAFRRMLDSLHAAHPGLDPARPIRYERDPRIVSRTAPSRLVAERYPRPLQARGVGGTAAVAAMVTPAGYPAEVRLVRTSGVPELDRAALEVARESRFESAVILGCRMTTWAYFPVTFAPPPEDRP